MMHHFQHRLARSGSAGLLRLGSVLTLLLLWIPLVSCGRRDSGPFNVIFISIDTLRADTMGIYGYARNTTPRLDLLSREGLVFDQAITVSNNTLISHASMLTGLYPKAHGTTSDNDGVILADSYVTMAEDFQARDFQTAAFTSHREWLSDRFGLHQGFDSFKTGYRSASGALGDVKDWFKNDRKKDQPYFCFIHLYDVHSDWGGRPYKSEAPFFGSFTKGYKGSLVPWRDQVETGSRFLLAVSRGEIQLAPEDVAYIKAQYDEGVAYTDNQLGLLLKALEPLDDTYVVITADHGEEFYEHKKMLHGSLYDEVVQVPLIILPPASHRKELGTPRRIPEQVRTIDLRPTLASLAGIPVPPGTQGVDLSPWLFGEMDECPADLVRLYQNNGLRHNGYKFITRGRWYGLFDLEKDPGEKDNLAIEGEMKARAETMGEMLGKALQEDYAIRARHMGESSPQAPEHDPEADARLRELGYGH